MLKKAAAAAVLVLAYSQDPSDALPVAARSSILSYTDLASKDINDGAVEAASRVLHSLLSAPAVLLGDWKKVEKCFASTSEDWTYRISGSEVVNTERLSRQPVTLRTSPQSIDFVVTCAGGDFGLSFTCAKDGKNCKNNIPTILTQSSPFIFPLDTASRSLTLLIKKYKGNLSLQLRFPDLIYGVGYRERTLDQRQATEERPPACNLGSSTAKETAALVTKYLTITHAAVDKFRIQEMPSREDALRTANLLIHTGRLLLPYYVLAADDQSIITQQEAKRELLQLAEEAKAFLFKLNDLEVPGSLNNAMVFKLKSGKAELPISKDYLEPDSEVVHETHLSDFPPVAPLEEAICGVLVHYMGADLRLSLGKTILSAPEYRDIGSSETEVVCVGRVMESYYWTAIPPLQSQPTEADAKRILEVIIGFHQPHTISDLKQMIAAHYDGSSDALKIQMNQLLSVYPDTADPRRLFGVTKPRAISRLR